MKILITGTSGFIGYHLANRLLKENYEIVGLDNVNDYYTPQLKYDRLKEAGIDIKEVHYNQTTQSNLHKNYRFIKLNLEDDQNLLELFKTEKFDKVVNLAAQAGVRYSLKNPRAYIDSNIHGFANILEACRHSDVSHLLYASSSSVYGLNLEMPFSVNHNVDHPVSLYAASKKSNELMAHTYSHLFNIPTTGFRFFTVYGPWGRPDMAVFLFTKAIIEGKPINVFNNGDMERDFTYIDDIIEGLYRVTINKPTIANSSWTGLSPDPSSSIAPYKVYNIGNNNPVKLMDFIRAIENKIGEKAEMNMMPIQPGDVPKTWADVENLTRDYNYKPNTSIEDGISRFIDWYCDYYQINR